MYNPQAFTQSDPSEIKKFIAENPFATLVTSTESEPKTSHIPMYYVEGNGKGFLVGHLAKANDHWLNLGRKSTAIFHGPHAYISSNWYETNNVVPTWNYVVVHVSGLLKKVENKELNQILDLMLVKHEQDIIEFKNKLDEKTRSMLEGQIVGVKMEIETIEGKWKLSQNKSVEVQNKIANRLLETEDYRSHEIAKMIMNSKKNDK